MPTKAKDVYKVQCDISGMRILVYNEDRSVMFDLPPGPEASGVIKKYGLGPLGKTYTKGEVIGTDDTFGFDFGNELEDWPRW